MSCSALTDIPSKPHNKLHALDVQQHYAEHPRDIVAATVTVVIGHQK